MTTEYRVELDRSACEGVFACLVRDDRFAEADDGLAVLESEDGVATTDTDGRQVVTLEDDRLRAARQAAAACPVDAIGVEVIEDE